MKHKLSKLEQLRGFAALYVFVGHLVLVRMANKAGLAGFFFRFGQEAVMLFFLISGFVIYYSVGQHRNTSFGDYFQRRFRRIYPIFVIALTLSALCCLATKDARSYLSARQILGNLFMLQDFRTGKPGVFISPLGGNVPLWSLSYEWWFYILFFPIYRFVLPNWRLHLVAGLSFVGFISYIFFPNQISLFLMYFILWWSGAELARNYLSKTPVSLVSQRWTIFYLAFFTACMWWQVYHAARLHRSLYFGIHPMLELRHFSACLAFAIAGILWFQKRWVGFDSIFGGFAVVAPISYALYVFHYPLAVSATYLNWIPSSALQTIGYIIVAFTVAYLAEVKLQPVISRWFERRFGSARRSANR